MCVIIHHVTKTLKASAGGESNKGKFAAVTTRTSYAPRVVTGPENAVSQLERRHSLAAPGLGGRVCVVVGDEDVNRSFF